MRGNGDTLAAPMLDPYIVLLRGDAAAAKERLARDPSSGISLLLEAGLCLADPEAFDPPSWERFAEVSELAVDPVPLARAAGVLARRALLRLELHAAKRWIDAGNALIGDRHLAPELRVEAMHLACLSGAEAPEEDPVALSRSLRESAEIAPNAIIDAVALRALIALHNGDLEAALVAARRASRMARTETLPQSEYLANVVLARVRRAQGLPHLGTRIASALAAVAPSTFGGWLAWELALAGSSRAAHMLLRTTEVYAGEIGRWARRLVDHLGQPDRPIEELTALAADVSAVPGLQADVRRVCSVVDPSFEGKLDAGLAEWRAGTHPDLPWGLHAIGAEPGAPDTQTASFVVHDGAPARRILPRGVARVPGAVRIEPARGPIIGVALSVLAFAGAEGIAVTQFLRAVYGERLVKEQRGTMLRVLIHRCRQALGDVGELTRKGDRLWLVASKPLVLLDPRSERPLGDRLLHLLARHRGIAAKDAAEQLNVPLRTLQLVLKTLIEDESGVQQERSGRRILYSVEDTTFSEPTRG